jgi:hypothetical protein
MGTVAKEVDEQHSREHRCILLSGCNGTASITTECLNLLLPNDISGSSPENALGMNISAAVVSIVPALIAPTLTLTSGLFPSSSIPLIGIVMKGMVNPSSTCVMKPF